MKREENYMEKILIVEDDQDIRDVLIEALTRWGYQTVTVDNGRQGLEMFRSDSFGLILTDIRMPIMDGLTMLKIIKKENSLIPIIVITGYPSVKSAVESLMEGADYYIVKPIPLDDLEAKILKSFEKRKIQQSLINRKHVITALLWSIPVWILLGFLIGWQLF
jgi:two-component system response regulator PilR (NtrC family)